MSFAEKYASAPGCKIALLGDDLTRWSGGNDLLRAWAGALWRQHEEDPAVAFSLLIAEDNSVQRLRRALNPLRRIMRDLACLRMPAFAKAPVIPLAQVIDSVGSFGGDLRALAYRTSARSVKSLNRLLVQQRFDVALPVCSFRGRLSTPWAGYIPDLQHRHFRQFFTSAECRLRERQFMALLGNARAVIVNSEDTRRDIEEAYPSYCCTLFSLPFAPVLNPEWLLGDPAETAARYRLPDRYFLISNQFWVHKSHITAFEALARLDTACADVEIVCTGNTTDYRQPGYFHELMAKISALKLARRIRILGLIPKHDQIQIMRRARAVLQPSLFEGGPGGGSVYDAVSIGVPVILSDIPVNCEIPSRLGQIYFFERGCPADLAEKMQAILHSPSNAPSNEDLLRRSLGNASRLGKSLLVVCNFVRSSSSERLPSEAGAPTAH